MDAIAREVLEDYWPMRSDTYLCATKAIDAALAGDEAGALRWTVELLELALQIGVQPFSGETREQAEARAATTVHYLRRRGE